MTVLQGFSLACVPFPFTLVDDTPLARWRVGCASAIISACALYSNRATEQAYRFLPRRLSEDAFKSDCVCKSLIKKRGSTRGGLHGDTHIESRRRYGRWREEGGRWGEEGGG